jgi:hypothetical protein
MVMAMKLTGIIRSPARIPDGGIEPTTGRGRANSGQRLPPHVRRSLDLHQDTDARVRTDMGLLARQQ